MAKNIDDRIFLFIGDHAFTLADLGPAADMRIDKAMQSILDQGLLGAEYEGVPWFEVIKSSGLKLEAAPSEEQVLQYELHARYEVALNHCKELNERGELTQADKDQMIKLRKEWQAAEKLCRLNPL